MTCRSAEYEDSILSGAPALHQAPVIEVSPISGTDVSGYFQSISWPLGTDWSPVYQNLRDHPDGPLAQALSTPLMISVARTVYTRLGGNPAELLDRPPSRRGTASRHL